MMKQPDWKKRLKKAVSVSNRIIKAGSIVVDTSAVINLFRGCEKAAKYFDLAQEVWLPVTVLGELYCGLLKCNNPKKERLRISEFCIKSLIVDNDEGTAMHYAEVYMKLEKQGIMIPINDIWVAAFAIRHKLPLLAKDMHFSRIVSLDLIHL